MRRPISTLLFALLLSGSVAFARNSSDLALQERNLSRQIFQSYLGKRDTADSLARLRETQRKLHATSPSAEISNLLHYLDLCIADLEKSLRTPLSPASIARIGELTRSIAEGSAYIAQSGMQKRRQLASR